MATFSIAQFLSREPSCRQSSTIAAAWQHCGSFQQDYLVLLDSEQYPVGILRTALIAAHRSGWGDLPVSGSIVEHLAAEIEPLSVVSAETSLLLFWQRLAQKQTHWAVVDARSHYMGLFNSAKLLQFMAAHPAVLASLMQANLPQTEPPIPIKSYRRSQDIAADLTVLCQQILVEVFEQVPLPLQVQSSSGQVLAQTASWQAHFAALPAAPQPLSTLRASQVNPQYQGSSHEESVKFLNQAPLAHLGLETAAMPMTATDVAQLPEAGSSQLWVWRVPIELNLAELVYEDSASCSKSGLETAARQQFCALPELNPLGQALRFWLVMVQPVSQGQPQVQALSSDRNLDLERTSLLRAELLGCLSHELKTPLTSLLGLSKLLQDPRLGALSDRQNRYAALIYQNARSLKATVNEILDLTRIESGRMTLTVKSIQIADLCHQALLQAEDYNRARGDGETRSHPLTLDRFHLKIELGLECLSVDELRLRQILIHLLSNALRCTPENGGLGLTVERQGGWILLSVWDTGVGIPTAQQRFIFHRLQRIENPLTQRFTGPGLGLILVRQLAQLQGGEISFVSRASQGSKFTLLLPMASTLSEAIARPLPAAANSGLVVVLEQDPTHIETIAQALEPSGYWPAIARSSQETLEKVRRLRPPVVLIDLRADDLNSEWLTQQLRAEAEEPLTLVAIAPSNTPLPHGGRFDHVLHLPLAANMLHQLFTQLKLATEPTLAAATVLLLKQSNALGGPLNSLDQLLQQYQCRVLEVDDIDQARLLAKIWHPQVILLDPDISDPDSYLRRLSQQPSLSSLPVVTLTNEMTQLANRFPGLKIFPCLAPLSNLSSAAPSSPLLEVIQVAIQACQQL